MDLLVALRSRNVAILRGIIVSVALVSTKALTSTSLTQLSSAISAGAQHDPKIIPKLKPHGV
ncbi:MAG: hypothetical protein QW547_02925 [Candidatus Bathyarchaeia archaeon]